MKRIILTLLAAAVLALPAAAQMKRPTIMVVPADVWCNSNGYMTKFDDLGTTRYVPDYAAALQSNSEIRSAIASIGNLSFRLPNMENVDEIGGAILGFVKGFLYCVLLCWLLSFLGIVIGKETMAHTTLGRFFLIFDSLTNNL